MKIAVITSTRADFGLLKNLIIKLKKNFNCKVVGSGTHFSNYYGNTYKEIYDSKIKIDYKISSQINTKSANSISKILSSTLVKTSEVLKKIKPDIVIVLGDRYEILGSSLAAYINRIPLAHIHGGELTYGVLDDAFRHSITKLSQIHFVSNKVYKRRVVQLGENPSSVFIVGGMGVDSIHYNKIVPKQRLEKKLNINFKKKNLIINFHPETMNKNSAKLQIKKLLTSLNKINDTTLIFTMPGAEIENLEVIRSINRFIKKKKFSYFIKSLGQQNYFSLLKVVDGVIGNSSSGLLEVPSFKIPTVDIGERQKGRIASSSVINVDCDIKKIDAAIKKIYDLKYLKIVKKTINPYGKYGASNKIVNILKKVKLKNLVKKEFYDLK